MSRLDKLLDELGGAISALQSYNGDENGRDARDAWHAVREEAGRAERQAQELQDAIDDVRSALGAGEHEGPRLAALRVAGERREAQAHDEQMVRQCAELLQRLQEAERLAEDAAVAHRGVWLAIRNQRGGNCPCCGRFGKRYGVTMDLSMLWSLTWLQNMSDGAAWIDIPASAPPWLIRSRRLGKLRYWGLVEQRQKAPGDDRHTSGLWRTTAAGLDYLQGGAIPRVAWVFDDLVELFSDDLERADQVSVGFSFRHMMGLHGQCPRPTP